MKLVPTTAAALIAGLMVVPLALPALAQSDPQSQSSRMDRPDDRGREDRPSRPDREDRPDRQSQQDRQDLREQRPDRGRIGALLRLNCRPNNAERLEIALVRASHRLELTEAQRPMFEEFRTTALAAQATFADMCEAAQPQQGATTSLLERLEARIAIDSARIEAWNEVLPVLTTLYDSLDDTQKALLDQGWSRRNRDVNRDDAPETPPETEAEPDAPAPTEEQSPSTSPTQS